MNIAVNSRILNSKYKTGVQNFLVFLRNNIIKINSNDTYKWLRGISSSSFYAPWFDYIEVEKRLPKHTELFFSPHGIIPIKQHSFPVVAVIHDAGVLIKPEYCPFWYRKYFTFGLFHTGKNADCIVVDSYSVKDELIRMSVCDERKIQVIPLGIDSYFGKQDDMTFKKNITKKYNSDNKKLLLLVSAHSPRKNIPTAVSAFNKINGNNRYKLLITGTTDVKIKQTEDILQLPYVSKRELRSLYQLAHASISFSTYEGFNLPILESILAGTPVITSDIPVNREFKLPEKYYCTLNNSNRLQNTIIALLNKPKVKPGNELINRLKKTYSWYKTAKQYSKLFHTFS